ncbi:TlpA family protein disulfide reductase [bacterium]|jgi:thiol-disulfide isomerase/thioredoxin|nr:TlpA family protein disulfide reductase [bacterium]
MRYFAVSGMVIGLILVAGCMPSPNLGRTSAGGLAVGDQAPAVQIQQLVHGPPLDAETASGVQVVEFWATWCGPCLAGMPHLSALQETYGDQVTILGITSEDLSTVESFLASTAGDGRTWADVVKYRMAIDADGATGAAYMRAAGMNSIPTAFIIGKGGVLQWIGHPASMDGPLKAVVEGTWQLPKTN